MRVAAETGVKEVHLQRLVFFKDDAIGLARPDQALYEQLSDEEAVHIERATALADELGIAFSASGGASEPGVSLKRSDNGSPWSLCRRAVDGNVFHRQWPRAAVLHRAVLAARLRELHARRRHPADLARDLDRAGLSRIPQGAQIRPAAGRLRRLRLAVEFVKPVYASAKHRDSGPDCPPF